MLDDINELLGIDQSKTPKDPLEYIKWVAKSVGVGKAVLATRLLHDRGVRVLTSEPCTFSDILIDWDGPAPLSMVAMSMRDHETMAHLGLGIDEIIDHSARVAWAMTTPVSVQEVLDYIRMSNLTTDLDWLSFKTSQTKDTIPLWELMANLAHVRSDPARHRICCTVYYSIGFRRNKPKLKPKKVNRLLRKLWADNATMLEILDTEEHWPLKLERGFDGQQTWRIFLTAELMGRMKQS